MNTSAETGPSESQGTRPWGKAVTWLLFLGPFFYATYGFSNWLASRRDDVGAVVFDWEHQIPFVAWTILPYWSLNFFYVASVFVCRTQLELFNHIKRLLTAQVIAVTCFLLFPLQFTFNQPQPDGWPGALFSLLGAFDKPFNQAPSLHIALVVVLWHLYAHRLRSFTQWSLNVWFLGIGATVLTTYQHHFIDIPTGALLGWFCVWLWPLNRQSPLASARLTADPVRRKLAGCYALASVILTVISFAGGGVLLWLVWPAISLALVALFYLCVGVAGFQKGPSGHIGVASRWLLAPYLLGAWFNSRWWTRSKPTALKVEDNVWLGRFPTPTSLGRYAIQSVVDLSAELSSRADQSHWYAFPSLDLIAPDADTLDAAARRIEQQRGEGRVLVCCALGYSRSAATVCCWLLQTKRARNLDDAIQTVTRANPNIVLTQAHRASIETALRTPGL